MTMDRKGVALIETLIAMAILGSTGLVITGILHEAIRGQAAADRMERTMTDADRVLTAMSLLKREELDRAIGKQVVGQFDITIQRPEFALYRVSVAERAAPERLLLVTVVHRPREPTQ